MADKSMLTSTLRSNCLNQGWNQEFYTSCSIISENRESRIENIILNVSQEHRSAMNTLEDIWQEWGLKEEQREKRNHTVFSLLQGYLKEMVSEEEGRKRAFQESIHRSSQELHDLCIGLGLPPHKPEVNLTLLQLEDSLKSRAIELKKEKNKRLSSLKEFRDEEEKLCTRLSLPQLELHFVGCPNFEQLTELEQNIGFLRVEKEKRSGIFKKIKATVLQFWEDLEMDPYTEFEMSVVNPDADQIFSLSAANLDKLKDLLQNLEQEHKQLLGEIDGLREKVKALWKRLEISQNDQDAFNNSNVGYTPNVTKELKKELLKLEALKQQHMQKFIETLRKELSTLWDVCHYGQEQRQEFRPYYEVTFTDEALSMHEHQVEVMKNYFKEHEHIFKQIQKRETIWKRKIEFENRPTNVGRLNNRGGALLKEEKLRKAIQKELPKLEAELKKIIVEWEKDQQAYFLYEGQRYIDRITNEHDQFEKKKEDKKIEKERTKKENLRTELAFGSKATPTKNIKRQGCYTPGRTPKLRKVDTTATPCKFIHSSICPSPIRTVKAKTVTRKPLTGVKSKVKAGAQKRKSMRRSSQRRRILSDHNQTLDNITVPSSSTNFSAPKMSVISGSMLNKPSSKETSMISYNDFQGGLDSPSRISSFLEKKTPEECKV